MNCWPDNSRPIITNFGPAAAVWIYGPVDLIAFGSIQSCLISEKNVWLPRAKNESTTQLTLWTTHLYSLIFYMNAMQPRVETRVLKWKL